MASTSSSKSGVQTSACHGVGLLCLLMLAPLAAATQFKVGGSDMGWKVPSDPNAYGTWANNTRFQIGDSLLFVYSPHNDSVLQVNDQDYGSCNTAKPIARFDDGNTEFTFKQSGRHFFISGVQDNCLKNESVVVVVMADRSRSSSGQTPSSPAPPSLKVVGAMSSIGALLGSLLFFVV